MGDPFETSDVALAEASAAGNGEYVVVAGDNLEAIAARYGHFWETLWSDPANSALKERRKDRNVLLPGDRLHIAPLRPKAVKCVTGRRFVFRRRGVPSKIAFRAATRNGRVFPNKRFQLIVGESVHEGRTDADGRVDVYVTADAETAKLSVWLEEDDFPEVATWTLRVSDLRPHDTVAGVQQRLNRIGYRCGREDSVVDEATRRAVAAFRSDHGLPAGETIDADLSEQLRTAAGF
jgi:hypothetical protein